MDNKGVYLQLYAKAPAPIRDYYGLTVTEREVILNVWNISYGPHVFPKRRKCAIDDFCRDKTLQLEIENLFGNHVLQFCRSLCRNELRMECLPTKIFLRVLRFLATKDILKLQQTSKIFFELCNRDIVWQLIFKKVYCKNLTRFEIKDALDFGWKHMLMQKGFRTEKKKILPKKLIAKSTPALSLNTGPKPPAVKPKSAIKKSTSTSKHVSFESAVASKKTSVLKSKSQFDFVTPNIEEHSKLNIERRIGDNPSITASTAGLIPAERRIRMKSETLKEAVVKGHDEIVKIVEANVDRCNKVASAIVVNNRKVSTTGELLKKAKSTVHNTVNAIRRSSDNAERKMIIGKTKETVIKDKPVVKSSVAVKSNVCGAKLKK